MPCKKPKKTFVRKTKPVGTKFNPQFKVPITIASIDSGQDGAIAIIRANSKTDINLLSIYDMPFNRDHELPHIQTAKIAEWLSGVDHVVLESVAPIAGKGSSKTMFRQGGSYFALGEAVDLAGKTDFFSTYSAQLWKSTIGVSGDVSGNKKRKTFDLVCSLFPNQLDLFCGPKGGMKDGRTDAVGIGLAWLKRNIS